MNAGQTESGALRVACVSHPQDPGGIRCPQQELTDLGPRQILGGLDLRRGRDCFEEKVRVHERVNDGVEQHHGLQPARLANDTDPHEKGNPRVVIHLQETRFLALQNQYPRVDKLPVLGNVKDQTPRSKVGFRPQCPVWVAVGIEGAVSAAIS